MAGDGDRGVPVGVGDDMGGEAGEVEVLGSSAGADAAGAAGAGAVKGAGEGAGVAEGAGAGEGAAAGGGALAGGGAGGPDPMQEAVEDLVGNGLWIVKSRQ